MITKTITCRGLIIDQNELLIVQLKENHDFTCLPGGKVEEFEGLHTCMERELIEELGIKPIIGKLAFINQGHLYTHNKDLLEFFFLIENSKDYRKIDISKASHGFEIYKMIWQPINTDNETLHPRFLLPELQNINTIELPKILLSE